MGKQEKKGNKAIMIAGGIALTVVGFVVIPLLHKKLTNKAVKKSYKSENIYFDNLGPDVVHKGTMKGGYE